MGDCVNGRILRSLGIGSDSLDTDGVAIAWAVWGIGAIITMLIVGCSLESIAGSLLNPEYWALKQIVK